MVLRELYEKNKLKVLYCRIGYMKKYNGIQEGDDKPVGGGAYNKKNIGHELYNFSEYNGHFYGFVQAMSNSINLKRIDETVGDTDFVKNVLVIWVATREGLGQCIVGWYENAIVYKYGQKIPVKVIESRIKADGSDYNDYLIETDNATLVQENRRTEKIIGMGESNVWYGNEEVNKQVINYIEKYNNNIQENVNKLEDISVIEGKEREALVKVRENQGVFKKQLLEIHNKCCLCNMNNKKLLIASHIKPWSESDSKEKLDPYNGLLLCPNHDKLFDLGYISFEDNGNILISQQLSEENKILLNVSSQDHINIYSGNFPYLKYHRETIFKK